MKRRKYHYTALSYIFIAMGLVVIFMMSDILFTDRNNLTLMKGALSTEFDDRGIYENVDKYHFMMTKDVLSFFSYMDILGFDLIYEMEDTDHFYVFSDRHDEEITVYRTTFLARYILWDFPEYDTDKIEVSD